MSVLILRRYLGVFGKGELGKSVALVLDYC